MSLPEVFSQKPLIFSDDKVNCHLILAVIIFAVSVLFIFIVLKQHIADIDNNITRKSELKELMLKISLLYLVLFIIYLALGMRIIFILYLVLAFFTFLTYQEL